MGRRITGRKKPIVVGTSANVEQTTRTARFHWMRLEMLATIRAISSETGEVPDDDSRFSETHPRSRRTEKIATPAIQAQTIQGIQFAVLGAHEPDGA